MDRNTITGIILIGLILITSTFLLRQPEKKAPPSPDAAATDTVAASQVAAAPDTTYKSPETAAVNVPEAWAAFAKGENKDITLENKDIRIRVSSKGGKITYAELKNYKSNSGKPLLMVVPEKASFGYQFSTGSDKINTEDLYFTPLEVSAKGVTMSVSLPNGQSISQRYAIGDAGYQVSTSLGLKGFNQVIPRKVSYIDLFWEQDALQQERDSSIAAQNATIHFRKLDENPDYLSETSDDEEKFKDKTDWVSFKQQFFCHTLIATKEPFINAELTTLSAREAGTVKHFKAALTLPFNHSVAEHTYDMQFFIGPLHYKTLRNVAEDKSLQLERQIPLGWSFSMISWVNRFIIIPVFNVLSGFIGNYGIIILILAIFIKLIVLPLTYKTYLSTAKMRLLKPELDELKAKHGDDMARMQQEQMKLYRRAGVSPFGGCLPLLFQMPILIAMFRFFPSSIELRQESFLWAHDLSTYDSIWDFGYVPIIHDIYGDHVSLFTLLMTISTLIYTRLNNSLSPQQNEFKWLSYIMPIMFLGFFNKYAAGLSLYYLYFNVLTFGQQYLFKLFIDEQKLKTKIEENKKKPVTKSKFQARLEDLAKKQQDMAKQKQLQPAKKKPTRRK